MTTKRFLICPGFVRSKTDGQEHHISGRKLIELYGLDPKECVIKQDVYERFASRRQPEPDYDPELIPLHPLYEGDYKESLLCRKVNDFYEYEKKRKLLAMREGRRSKQFGDDYAIPYLQKAIAWHERHWPDFRAAYEQRHKR